MQHYDIAAELAATRVKRGLTLFDISHKTKIQVEHLQKLESGCYDFLPRFYVRQIVRMYAEALGLPADTIISTFVSLIVSSLSIATLTCSHQTTRKKLPHCSLKRSWSNWLNFFTYASGSCYRHFIVNCS